MSKELQAIIDSVEAYAQKHDHRIQISLALVAFDKNYENVLDDWMCMYGLKGSLKFDIDLFQYELDHSKEEFVNI